MKLNGEQRKLVADHVHVVEELLGRSWQGRRATSVLGYDEAMSLGLMVLCEESIKFPTNGEIRFANWAGASILWRWRKASYQHASRQVHYREVPFHDGQIEVGRETDEDSRDVCKNEIEEPLMKFLNPDIQSMVRKLLAGYTLKRIAETTGTGRGTEVSILHRIMCGVQAARRKSACSG